MALAGIAIAAVSGLDLRKAPKKSNEHTTPTQSILALSTEGAPKSALNFETTDTLKLQADSATLAINDTDNAPLYSTNHKRPISSKQSADIAVTPPINESPQPPKQQPTATENASDGSIRVTGSVVDEYGKGIAKQLVRLRSKSNNNLKLQAVTDERGHFLIEGARPGNDYLVRLIVKGAYRPKQLRHPPLSVYDNMPALRLDVESTGTGALGLYITKTDGYPLSKHQFDLFHLRTLVDTQLTDDAGFILFENVPATGGRTELTLRNRISPIIKISDLALTRDERNESIRANVNHGEARLLVNVKSTSGKTLTDINARLRWVDQSNRIKAETLRVIDNSENGRNEVPLAQQQPSNPERTVIQFINLSLGTYRLELDSLVHATYGEPIIVDELQQTVEITLQSIGATY